MDLNRTFKRLNNNATTTNKLFLEEKPEREIIPISEKDKLVTFLERNSAILKENLTTNLLAKNLKSNEYAKSASYDLQFPPIWAIGLAIVIGVVFGGLTLALISAFLCYKRQRTRMRTRNINNNNAPTLHAFMPQTIGTNIGGT